jgi:hypothetical protein
MKIQTKILIGFLIILVLVSVFLIWWKYQISGNVSIVTDKKEYEIEEVLKLTIENNLNKNICFSSCYPYYLERKNGEWKSYPYGKCQKTDLVINCIKPGEKKAFQIDDLSYAKEGLHRLSIPVCINCKLVDPFKEEKRFYSNEFRIKEKKEVTIIIDKREYEQSETIKIIVRNGLDKSIWYMDLGCYPWWKIEKREGDTWKSIDVLLPTLREYGEECVACLPPISIEEVSKELKSKSEISDIWDLRKCNGAIGFIEPGIYRFSFSYGFSKDSINEKKIYSHEFTIKEKAKTEETADWKTYKNEEWGYEVKYPKDTHILEQRKNKSLIRIYFPVLPKIESKYINIKVKENISKDCSIEESFEEIGYYPPIKIRKKETVYINDIEFLKEKGDDYNCVIPEGGGYAGACYIETDKEGNLIKRGKFIMLFYYTRYSAKKNNSCFYLTLSLSTYADLSESEIEQESEVLNQILSTFRFLE